VRLGDVSGVAAVANGEVERAGAGNGDDGCSALRWLLAGEEGGRGETKMERGRGRADAGGVKARSGATWPARSGQRRRAAVAGDTRRANSAVGRPLNASFSFVRNTMAEPDSAFST